MILFTYGTRPEYLKVKPLINEFKKRGLPYEVMTTGQHNDIIPKDDNVMNLNINECDKLSTNRLDNVIATTLWHINDIFDTLSEITHVLVQGDTTSVLALALSAFHHKKKIIHLEAGLRTYDFENPFPEEANRQLVSRITDIHLAPTQSAADNLLDEGIPMNKIYVVGNTVLDNLLPYLDKCEYGDKILVTLHRRENHDIMDRWFEEIEKLATKYYNLEFIIPLHPNPNVQKHKHIFKNVSIIEPLNHSELLNILVKSKLVITDSGGIQEECSFFKKFCLICRKETERPESLGLTSYLVRKPNDLSNAFELHEKNYIPIEHSCPYGNGNSSQIITSILKELIYE
jgi:UDP-N-acetylglucosamine 2-epimerase (non-hydrolysing)